MAFHIDKGTTVNGAWTNKIAYSADGTNWEPRDNTNMSVSKVYINPAPAEHKYPVLATISITTAEWSETFSVQDIKNKPAWTADLNGLQAALNEIGGW